METPATVVETSGIPGTGVGTEATALAALISAAAGAAESNHNAWRVALFLPPRRRLTILLARECLDRRSPVRPGGDLAALFSACGTLPVLSLLIKNPPPFAVLEAAEITHSRASPARGNGNLASDLESGSGAVGAVLTESAAARRRACGDGSRGPAVIRSTPGPVALFLSMGAVLDLLHRRPRRRRRGRVARVGARHLSFYTAFYGGLTAAGEVAERVTRGAASMFRGRRLATIGASSGYRARSTAPPSITLRPPADFPQPIG
jgi:hypothetical protein